MTPNAAMLQAGFRKPTMTLRLDDAEAAAGAWSLMPAQSFASSSGVSLGRGVGGRDDQRTERPTAALPRSCSKREPVATR